MNHRAKEALDLFEQMTIAPSTFTLSIFFKICAQLADDRSFQLGKKVFQSLSDNDRSNPLVATPALKLLMKKDRVPTVDKPDLARHFQFFHACAQSGTKEALALGKKTFEELPKEYREDTNVGYAVFDMFVRCDDLDSAETLFRQLKRDAICYSSLMNLSNEREQPEKSLALYEEMQAEKIPSDNVLTQSSRSTQ